MTAEGDWLISKVVIVIGRFKVALRFPGSVASGNRPLGRAGKLLQKLGAETLSLALLLIALSVSAGWLIVKLGLAIDKLGSARVCLCSAAPLRWVSCGATAPAGAGEKGKGI